MEPLELGWWMEVWLWLCLHQKGRIVKYLPTHASFHVCLSGFVLVLDRYEETVRRGFSVGVPRRENAIIRPLCTCVKLISQAGVNAASELKHGERGRWKLCVSFSLLSSLTHTERIKD